MAGLSAVVYTDLAVTPEIGISRVRLKATLVRLLV